MGVLVIVEHEKGELKPATLNAVTAAKEIGGGPMDLLVIGQDCGAVAEAAAKITGVSRVLVADGPALAHHLAENAAPVIVGLASGYSHILAAATTTGKNIMPRVAALLDVAQISEISAVVSEDTFVRPIYAGNAMATVQSADPVKVITVRTTTFDAAEADGGSAAVEAVDGGQDAGECLIHAVHPGPQLISPLPGIGFDMEPDVHLMGLAPDRQIRALDPVGGVQTRGF